MPVYRYKLTGVDVEDLKAQVPPADASSITAGQIASAVVWDVTALATSKDDLDTYFTSRGWTFVEQDPIDTPESAAADGIANRITVGTSGAVDHFSIKAAIDAAVLAGATASNWFLIEVFPGTYPEDPMTVPAGVIVANQSSIGSAFVRNVKVVANDPSSDLFTLTGGVLMGMHGTGVTSASKAVFRASTPGAVNSAYSCSISDCENGAWVSGGAVLVTNFFNAVIQGPGEAISTAMRAEDAGTILSITAGVFAVDPALLPAYADNPIQTAVLASGARVIIQGSGFSIAPKNSTQVAIKADSGANVAIQGSDISESYTAVQIGAGGTGTKISVQSTSFTNNTVDFDVQSSTGVINANCSVDLLATSIVAGGIFSGIVLNRTSGETQLIGEAAYIYGTSRSVDLPTLFHDQVSSGVTTGGVVTDGGGLSVDVTAGTGWIHRHALSFDITYVTWSATPALALTASATNYIYYDGAGLTGVVVSTSVPSDANILLAVAVTDGSAIRFLHVAANLVTATDQLLHDYLLATRRFRLDVGLAVSQGSGVTKIQVDLGSYYRALTKIPYGGSGGDATWSYFYGSGGATEVPGVTDLDTAQYDNAGTLTPLTAGWYRADTVVLTSDGRLSIIYGSAEYVTVAQAEESASATVPAFMEESGVVLALVVVEEGVGIESIVDRRPIDGTSGGGGGSGVTDHGLLAGLGDDDHPQYLLVDGSRAMGGDLDMGANAIVSVGLVDGVDVSDHSSRHDPGGIDALSTAAAGSIAVGDVAAEGSAASLSRSDHKHALPAPAAPADVTKAAASAGAATTVARADHKHDVSTAIAGAIQPDDTAAEGTATSLARSDHRHAITAAAPGTIAVGDAAAEGVATSFARSDHTHALAAPAAPVDVTKAAASAGVATTVARSDHKHDISTAAPGTIQPDDAAAEGTATSLARSDHKHSIAAAAPTQGIGGSNAEGSSTSFARADHDHTIRETGGPTDLTVAAIADGQFVRRVGTTLVGTGLHTINGMRLTGVSATPVMTADSTSLNTIYLTPFISNQISLYNGTTWVLFATAEVSLTVTGRTTDLPFDIFAYDSGGTVTLEFTNWTNATTRATALVLQDGVWVRTGATTRRYLGTCRPRSATTFHWVTSGTDLPCKFDLWNASNRVLVGFTLIASTSSWTYTTATWRQAQASTNYQVDLVCGVSECLLDATLIVTSANSAIPGSGVPREVGIGYDSTTVFSGLVGSISQTGNAYFISSVARLSTRPGIGRHFYAWLEISTASSTTTWYGNNGAARMQSGMSGSWYA